MFDVVVIGGGPAGLSAALMLGRVRRSVLLLDTGAGRNAPATSVHNFLTRDGTTPAELRRLGGADLDAYPSVRRSTTGVESVERSARDGEPAFEVTLAGGGVEYARRVLLATGVRDHPPEIDGMAALWGRSALHCPYCHGYEVRDRPIAVLGGGPGRVRLALHLSRLSSDVLLCSEGESVPDELLARHGVGVRAEPVLALEGGRGGDAGQLTRIRFADGPDVAREAIFVPTVPRQASDLPERLGVFVLEGGAVEVDEMGRTSVPGLWAAGDMCRRAAGLVGSSAVVLAAASGAIAGGAIDQDLVTADFGLATALA